MTPSATRIAGWVRATASRLGDRVTETVGGRARRRAILLLAAVLSLQSADSGAVGALAAQLERAFHVGNTQIGLLVTVTSLVAALAALPMGVLTDRSNRVRLLVIGVGAWAAAMVATGLAGSYASLLVARLALGVVTAVAGPTVASLIGTCSRPPNALASTASC